ncbi:MAG: VCBS repeat-containing protein [Candidatus Latescibacteria bacterium]|nr:VCBS repeat-containing protein [Candidatus Latescibacterota bacterium]
MKSISIIKIEFGIILFFVLIFSPSFAQNIPFNYKIIDSSPPKNPWTKIVGDINCDGFPDIIVGGQKGPLVWYKYPSWSKSIITEGGYNTVDGEIGDIDKDGDPDIIMGGLYWYENPLPDGNPEGNVWNMHKIADHPTHDIEVGDLDKDGDLDIVTRDQSEFGHNAGNKIHVWLQKDIQTWSELVIECPHGEGITLADIDADNYPDIITGGIWYKNPGSEINGAWTDNTFASWHSSATVKSADINGDGRKDIVLTPSELKDSYYKMSWFENPVNPLNDTWIEHVIENNVECVVHALETIDINADGLCDIITAEMHQGADPDEVSIYINKKQGSSWQKLVISQKGSHYIRVADIGSDGDIDIIGANHGGEYQPVELWENTINNTGGVLNLWTYINVDRTRQKWGDWNEPAWLKYFGLDMADVTGDGYKDVVSGRYFYRNPGGDMTAQWVRTDLGFNVDGMLFVDVDGDRYGDVIAEALPDVYWIEADDINGKSWKANKISSIPKTGHVNGQGYKLAQIKKGGKPEILLSSGDGIYCIGIPANPTQGTWPTIRIAADATEEGIGVGDIDGDGDIDVAAGSGEKKGDGMTVSWWENPGDGSADWKIYIVGETIRFADRFEIADLNGDGLADVIVTEERWPEPEDAHVFWFEQQYNVNKRTWVRHTISTQNTSNNLDIADMDGDGDIDIITAEHRGSKKLQIWENNDRGNTWTEHVLSVGKENHLGARVSDINNDGDLDIIGIAWDDYQFLHLWRNDTITRRK